MGRDTIQLEDVVSTISEEYLLEFTLEYGIPESLHPELPGPEETIVDFSEGKVGVYTKFFEFANYRIPLSQFLFDIIGHYQIHLLQLSVIGAAKQVAGEEHPSVLYEAPRLPEELEQPVLLSGRENIPPPSWNDAQTPQRMGCHQQTLIPRRTYGLVQLDQCPESYQGNDGADANASPKVLKKDHMALRPTHSTLGGKSLAAMGLDVGSTLITPATQETPSDAKSVSDPDPLSYAKLQPRLERDVAQ
ncbi:hypothetical protein Tco_0556122 [Tanacetum coccineum]